MVWIFARKATPGLASLVRQLDDLAQNNASSQLKLLVNFVGPERASLVADAARIERELPTKSVVWAIPKRHDIGDRQLKLAKSAETTVLVAKKRKITANHALPVEGLSDARIAQIIADVQAMLP